MLKKSAIEFKTIGSILKSRRLERSLTLDNVSKAIKIRKKYLEALEEGKYNAFASEVYTKGFLKNYAHYLGVDTSKAIALYRREQETMKNEPLIKTSGKLADKGIAFDLTPNKIILACVAIVIVIIVGYIGLNISKVLQVPELVITEPVALTVGEEGVFKTKDDNLQLIGKVEVGSKLSINDQVLDTGNFEAFIKELILQEGLNTFIIKAESQFGKTAEITLNVIRESGPAATPTPSIELTPTPSPITPVSVELEIIDREAFLTLTIDGETMANRTYQVGEKISFTANNTITVASPRPDALVLKFNGVQQSITTSQTYRWNISSGQAVLIP